MAKKPKAVVEEPVEKVVEEPVKKKLKKKKAKTVSVVESAAVEAPKRKLKKKRKAAAVEEPAAEEAKTDVPKKKKLKKKSVVVEPVKEDSDLSSSEEEMPVPVKKAPAKEAEAPKATGGEEEWKDQTIKCMDCSGDFVDTADDQSFRWDKGFTDAPKRCKDCRWAKKQRVEEGGKDGKGKGKGKGKDGKGKGKDGKGKGKDGKKGGGGICYKFQSGNCTFTDCKFSHTS